MAKGYFVRHGEGGEVWSGYSNSSLLDISNPQAYQWTLNMIVEVRRKGEVMERGWGWEEEWGDICNS